MAYQGPNPPTQLEISKMYSSLDANDSVVKGCRFVVRINLAAPLLQQLGYQDQVNNHLLYACDSAEFPGRAFQTTEVRYYGPRQMMPNNSVYGEGINMSFMCRSKTLERQFFDDWMDIINPPTSYHFKYPNEYYTDIEIFQFAEFGSGANIPGPGEASVPWGPVVVPEATVGISRLANPLNYYQPEPIYAFRLLRAWPMVVAPQQVTWADSDILRLQVTFAFRNWTRQGDTKKIADKVSRNFANE